ncbi:hypothetical protein RUK35_003438, partial [Vibrio cholerae]|nr:hypothetical protein [Vibrio cholerae]
NMVVKEDTIVEIIEGLINKIIYKKYNGYFYHAITGNRLSNLYGYAQESKVILNNVKLISRLIDEIDSYDIRDKINILQEFVLKIYDISSEDIKEKIKSFSIGIDTSKEKDIYTKIIFDLTLVIYGFKEINDQNISEVEAYLEQYKDGSTFSTALYLLDSYIDHLIKNKNLESEFEISSKLIKNSIDLYEKRDRLSII